MRTKEEEEVEDGRVRGRRWDLIHLFRTPLERDYDGNASEGSKQGNGREGGGVGME